MHKRLLLALSLLPLAALGVALRPAPTLASGFPRNCAGTYLISEAGGARDFANVSLILGTRRLSHTFG